jgi:rhamnopyranosyl-N-acetylglucosaminyl-diphospho-decaprenol beta-1,3/1,4-galactofuranosyltransferase
MSLVVTVVVTRHRRESLGKSLAVIGAQTRAPDHLVVVDNGPDDPAADIVADCPIPSTYLPSRRNLGGAGGFALGILHALALGADWVWLADDDGCPADVRVLQTLLEEAKRRDLAVISPVVVNIDDPERLAFPLFSADALDVVGVPDYRLFVRGDEVDVHRRVVRSGLRFGTTLRASYAHPDGSAEFKPMLRGHFHAQDPSDEIKRYYTYRNRGYLLSQPGMRRIGMLEVFRFGLYFLGTKRDPQAFRQWLKLLRQGRAERFYRH